jgi:hypothetical protein
MANIIEYASKFASVLDKKFEAKSVTSFFADPEMEAQFVGAKEVSLPELDLSGLSNYDRATGFENGAITISRKVYKLKNDRAKSFALDRMDTDESGVAGIAGKIMGEFVRTKVVPEVDAYVISELTKVATAQSNTAAWNAAEPFAVFNELLAGVQEASGYDEEIICFVDSVAYGALKTSDEFEKSVVVSEFKQGAINTKVKTVDGVAIIPVPSNRMKDLVTLLDSEAGGFSTDGGKQVHMLMLPKRAAHLVKKTEKVRVFAPDVNQQMDAYKFDYRIYYDVFVRNSELKAVWASVDQA